MVEISPDNRKFTRDEQLYICSGSGLGGTGKTSIGKTIQDVIGRMSGGRDSSRFKEPPREEFGGFSPYEILAGEHFEDSPMARLPYMAAIRHTMWNNTDFPWYIPDDVPVLIGDRSPFDSFLQHATPIADVHFNPWGKDVWKLMYGQFNIPFPDILPLLHPADGIASVEERLRGRKEGALDVFDLPGRQKEEYAHFLALAEVVSSQFPGVYNVMSGQILPVDNELGRVDAGLILGLLSVAAGVEKGAIPTLMGGGQSVPLYRLGADPRVTAYYYDLGKSLMYESNSEVVRKGAAGKFNMRSADIGVVWSRSLVDHYPPPSVVAYALEPGAKGMKDEEINNYLRDSITNSQFTLVSPETRYGSNLYQSRFPGTNRAWSEITW